MKVVKCDCCGKELVGRIFKFAFEIEDEFGNIITGRLSKSWSNHAGFKCFK